MSEPDGFLKRHGFLVAGVALPILVVVVFVLARTLPRLWVADPLYDLVYAVRPGYAATPRTVDADVSVVDGRLRVRWMKTENAIYQGPLQLFRLNPASESVVEIPLLEPDDLADAPGTRDSFLEGFGSFRVDSSPRSPDGYEFDGSAGGGSGLLSELFVNRHRRAHSVIRKSGRVIVLPRTDDSMYGYSTVQFVGWLVPVEAGR
ncbi:MAG: hypothetical protein ACKVXR_17985 [Planctomycetota bacterium]